MQVKWFVTSHLHETVAYFVAILATICGVWAGVVYEAAWLGRAGSVVIVAGVSLAASRKIDTLSAKVLDFIDKYRKDNPDLVRDVCKELGDDPLTPERIIAVEGSVYDSAQKELGELIKNRRRLFKLHEVVIVIYGTLLNGFGEWLVKVVLCMHSNVGGQE